jgi:predicted RNase H-like HicB family nuclease
MSESTRRYPANVFWSEDDQGFIATAPDLPGCSAFGESQTEALGELEQAVEAWIEAAKAAKNPIPEPSRPAVEALPSGKLLVRMPVSLHATLSREANSENVSLNQYIVFLLTTAVTHRTVGRTAMMGHQGYAVTRGGAYMIAHYQAAAHSVMRVRAPESGLYFHVTSMFTKTSDTAVKRKTAAAVFEPIHHGSLVRGLAVDG